MSSIGILFELVVIVLYFGHLLLLLVVIILRRGQGKKIFPHVVGFLFLAASGIYIYSGMKSRENAAATEYIKEYKLQRLDGNDCPNCIVKVHQNHRYDILQNNQVIGSGKWKMELEREAGFYFLVLENGSSGIISNQDSIIEFINRPIH